MPLSRLILFVLAATFFAARLEADDKPKAAAAPPSAVCNRVRFFPVVGGEQGMVGGRIEGSNVSRRDGFVVLAEIVTAPAPNTWTELTFDNTKIYRWLRYVCPPVAGSKIAEIEFYAGDRKLSGRGNGFGSIVKDHASHQAFDENTRSYFESETAGQGVGIDLRDVATARRPSLEPAPGDFDGPLTVTLKSTPGAVIRYTLDGTWPTETTGTLYSDPIRVEKSTTIEAVAFLEGRAASVPSYGTYLLAGASKPGFSTFHLGNSLTQTTSQLSLFARTAGYKHKNTIFAMPGAPTKKLWDVGLVDEKERWEKTWGGVTRVDHLTLQPRDFNIPQEADYDVRFIDLVRKKSPDVQPWLYVEWTEMKRQRPTDLGNMPSSQMKKLYPALTWEESMAGMLLYIEELQTELAKTNREGKPPRVLPTALAMGWIKNMIDNGKIPGLKPGTFYATLFNDQVHPSVNPWINENANGGYLVDLTWYSAFYRESPAGKVLPIGTTFTTEQAGIIERLAWDVIENYPDCGLYREGTASTAPPTFSPAAQPSGEATPVTLESVTPGAWFRYTLDGTVPTRTRGYVYCGVISVRPGNTVKAIAYKSGHADSAVAEFSLPDKAK